MFALISSVLPPSSALGSGADLEEQTRAVLTLLMDRTQSVKTPNPIHVSPKNCPNCGIFVETMRSPYCGDDSREMSAFIRQCRSAVEDDKTSDIERQVALGQKLWYVLGGGYPRRDVLIPIKVRIKVLEREGSRCQQCGAKATTIDHSGSG